MAYSLDGQVYLELYFNDVEFPFSQINTFSFVHISASSKKALPALSMKITDGERWLLQNNVLADGVRVRVGMAAGSLETAKIYRWNFRISHFDEKRTDTGVEYHIDALLDFPEYISRSSKVIVPNASSSAVLQQIASSVGMQYLGVGTNDTQTWLPSNRRFYQFAGYVAEHGYATENSCMIMAVDLNGTLIYRDITSMDNAVAKLTMVDIEQPGVIPIVSFLPVSSPGGFNQMSGYAYSTIEQDLNSTTVHTSHDAIGTVINDGGDVLVNADVKNSIEAGRVRFSAVDAGNTHDNFYRAQHQNKRVAGLFTSGLAVTTPVITGLQVLDTVTIDAGMTKQLEAGATGVYEGNYRVASRVILAVPGQIVEKLSLVRRTLNQNLPNSVPTASSTTTSNSSSGGLQNAARTTPLKPPVPSTISFTSFSPSTITSAITAMGTAGVAFLTSAASNLTSSISSASTAASAVPSCTTLLNTLLANITTLTNAAIANIQAGRLSDPTADTDGTTAARKAAGIASVTSAINTQKPAIATAADQATSVAGSSVAVNTSSTSATGLYGNISAALSKVMTMLSNVDKTGSSNSAASTGSSNVASSSSTATSSIGSAASASTAASAANLNSASTYSTQITNAQTVSTNAINAA